MESTHTPAIKAADTATMVQWRNIQKVVRELADFCFGSADNAMYGVCHVALINALTAKDGLSVTLEPLPDTPAIQAVAPILTDERIVALYKRTSSYPLDGDEDYRDIITFARLVESDIAAVPAQQPTHSDNTAVDTFADAMKRKLAVSRDKGRGGWDDPAQCSIAQLAEMLVAHVAKGDPVDIGNFAMMLHIRQQRDMEEHPCLGRDAVWAIQKAARAAPAAPVAPDPEFEAQYRWARGYAIERGAKQFMLNGETYDTHPVAQAPVEPNLIANEIDGWLSAPVEPVSEDKRDAELAARCVNIASQCRATASSEVALMVIVDGGSGTLRELLIDAADAIAATPSPTKEST